MRSSSSPSTSLSVSVWPVPLGDVTRNLPVAVSQNNQTPINNKGVCHGCLSTSGSLEQGRIGWPKTSSEPERHLGDPNLSAERSPDPGPGHVQFGDRQQVARLRSRQFAGSGRHPRQPGLTQDDGHPAQNAAAGAVRTDRTDPYGCG